MFTFLFAEKKLDSFVMSQPDSSSHKMSSHHRDSQSMMNYCYIDMSPARNAANDVECRRLPSEFSDSGSVRPSCTSINMSELKADDGTEAADVSSPCETTYTNGQHKRSVRKVELDRVDDCVVDPGIAAGEQDVVDIDRNCNNVFRNDCEPDLNVSSNDSIRSVGYCPSLSLYRHNAADDGIPQSDPLLHKTNIVTDSLQDTSAIMTV